MDNISRPFEQHVYTLFVLIFFRKYPSLILEIKKELSNVSTGVRFKVTRKVRNNFFPMSLRQKGISYG